MGGLHSTTETQISSAYQIVTYDEISATNRHSLNMNLYGGQNRPSIGLKIVEVDNLVRSFEPLHWVSSESRILANRVVGFRVPIRSHRMQGKLGMSLPCYNKLALLTASSAGSKSNYHFAIKNLC
jgi:hypothetical protein